jgi:hypothetical protein
VATIFFREMLFTSPQYAIDVIVHQTGENRTSADYAKTLVDKLAEHNVRVYQLMETLREILPTQHVAISTAFSTDQRVRDADVRSSLEANSSTNASSQPAEDSRGDFTWTHVAALGAAANTTTSTADNNTSTNGVVYNNGAAHFQTTTSGVGSQTTTTSSAGLDMLATTAIGPVARPAESKVDVPLTPVATVVAPEKEGQAPNVQHLRVPKISQTIVVRKIPTAIIKRFARETKLSAYPLEYIDHLCTAFEPHWRELAVALNFDVSQVVVDGMNDRLATEIVIYTARDYGLAIVDLNNEKFRDMLSLEKKDVLFKKIAFTNALFIDLHNYKNNKKRKPIDLVEDDDVDDKLLDQEKRMKTQ